MALPAALATVMQYSTTAPGIILGLVVPLNGSLITRLVLVAVSAAARTGIVVLREVDAVAGDVAARVGVREHGVDAGGVGAGGLGDGRAERARRRRFRGGGGQADAATSPVDPAERNVGDDEDRPAGVGGDLVEDR